MNHHTLNLITANFWKQNQFRYRNKMNGRTQIFVADCGERIPHWVLIGQGIRGLSMGWNHHNCFFGQERPAASTHSIGRQTQADLDSGFSGGLCKALAREAWSRHERGAPGEHEDNHLFGISDESWVRMRWARSGWAKRRTQGWSGKAVVKWLWRKHQDQYAEDKWSIGCPAWYAEHQP